MRAASDRSRRLARDRLAVFVSSLQLADSFFPSGLYALSYGLETLAERGLLRVDSIEGLLASYLRHGVGPADGTALACAHRAAAKEQLDLAAEADARLTAVKLAREARETSTRVGRQLLSTVSDVFGGDLLVEYAERVRAGAVPGNHAVVLGLVMAVLGIRRERAVAGELYSFASSAAGAAVRLSVIDHRMAQRVLHRLGPVIADVARACAQRNVHEIASSTPLIDVMCMQHEQADLRMFMS